jgi:hypothetical protein
LGRVSGNRGRFCRWTLVRILIRAALPYCSKTCPIRKLSGNSQLHFSGFCVCACASANSQIGSLCLCAREFPKLSSVCQRSPEFSKQSFYERCLALANSQISFSGSVRLVETITPLFGVMIWPVLSSWLYESPVALFCERLVAFWSVGYQGFPRPATLSVYQGFRYLSIATRHKV